MGWGQINAFRLSKSPWVSWVWKQSNSMFWTYLPHWPAKTKATRHKTIFNCDINIKKKKKKDLSGSIRDLYHVSRTGRLNSSAHRETSNIRCKIVSSDTSPHVRDKYQAAGRSLTNWRGHAQLQRWLLWRSKAAITDFSKAAWIQIFT